MTSHQPASADTPVEENQVIGAERMALGIKETTPVFGLALSGGGIRSASFCMGVLQSLFDARKDKTPLLDQFHYLSTVSGGGYIGSSLTWFRSKAPGDGYPVRFPFGVRTGAKSADVIDNATRDRAEHIETYIRQHGNYLVPNQYLDFVSAFATVLRVMLWSLTVYFGLIFSVVGALYAFFEFKCRGDSSVFYCGIAKAPPEIWQSVFGTSVFGSIAFAALLGSFLVGGLYSLISSAGSFLSTYRARLFFQGLLGFFVYVFLAMAVLAAIPAISDYLQSNAKFVTQGLLDMLGVDAETVGGGSVALGVIYGLVRFAKEFSGRPPSGITATLMSVIGPIAIVFGFLLLTYRGAEALYERDDYLTIVIAIGAVSLFLGWLANINRISIHQMYRDRLMEVFMPSAATAAKETWGPANAANAAKLSTFTGANQSKGLYHLVNTTVLLPNASNSTVRSRGGDNFVLSPLYCGSDATQYKATAHYMGDSMTLASAMAISGAAVNPHAGVGGEGLTRNPFVSFLMTLLNVRLGAWVRNPGRSYTIVLPNFIRPGLSSLLPGFGRRSENSGFVELSDGGHFENLGIYELIRRRAKVIVSVDGAADEDFAFGDLGNAIEKARADFDTIIEFLPEWPLKDIAPPPSGSSYDARFGIAKRGHAIARIIYPNGTNGVFIYIKATMTDQVSADIVAYRAQHNMFPNQPTFPDQFFDEKQLEAYRELGYDLCDEMIDDVCRTARDGKTLQPDFGKELKVFAEELRGGWEKQ